MTTMEKRKTSSKRINLDFNMWINEHITKSWLLTLWVLLLTVFTIQFTRSRLEASLASTIIVLIVWAVSLAITIYSELIHSHTAVSLWLRNNLYSSITTVQLTLIIVLGIIAMAVGLFNYAVQTASFLTTPATDIRAEFVSATTDQFCFNVGSVNVAGP